MTSGVYDAVLGSRDSRGRRATRRHAALQVRAFNRVLTLFQNLLLGAKLSEYHTGYRAFSAQRVGVAPRCWQTRMIFVFDNEMLTQAIAFGFQLGEIPVVPQKYFPEASSISFRRSVTYGIGVSCTCLWYRLAKWRLARPRASSAT